MSAIPSVLITVLTVIFAMMTTSATAGNMYVYKNSSGQVLLTNTTPSGNFQAFNKKVKETYYPDSQVRNPTNNTSASHYGQSVASRSANRNAYDALIRSSAARHGVDPALMKAMMHTESAFNPNARSPVGAQGLMQLMPATARRFSVNNTWSPAENIEGAAKYIAWLMRRFNNNVEFAIAGYNAGEGNVDKYGGIPPFRETRNYVKSVLSRYHGLYKHDSSLFVSGSQSIGASSDSGHGYISDGTSSYGVGNHGTSSYGVGNHGTSNYGANSHTVNATGSAYVNSAYAALR